MREKKNIVTVKEAGSSVTLLVSIEAAMRYEGAQAS